MADSYEPRVQLMNGKLEHGEITEEIIGAALEVH